MYRTGRSTKGTCATAIGAVYTINFLSSYDLFMPARSSLIYAMHAGTCTSVMERIHTIHRIMSP